MSTSDRNLRFVVQRHRARTLHFDRRLEREGVFKSWAVPKGVPEKVGVKRLAVQVEDHALEFGEFEGMIPAGEYGAGTVEFWVRGTYEAVEWQENRIVVDLHGERLFGIYNLMAFPRAGRNAWLVFKGRGDPQWSHAPKTFMLATPIHGPTMTSLSQVYGPNLVPVALMHGDVASRG